MTVSEVFCRSFRCERICANFALLTVTGPITIRAAWPGELFFAFEGQHADGRRFAADAAGRARCSGEPVATAGRFFRTRIEGGMAAGLWRLAAREFFMAGRRAYPGDGITGTNGKTTTVYLVDAVLRAANRLRRWSGRSSII